MQVRNCARRALVSVALLTTSVCFLSVFWVRLDSSEFGGPVPLWYNDEKNKERCLVCTGSWDRGFCVRGPSSVENNNECIGGDFEGPTNGALCVQWFWVPQDCEPFLKGHGPFGTDSGPENWKYAFRIEKLRKSGLIPSPPTLSPKCMRCAEFAGYGWCNVESNTDWRRVGKDQEPLWVGCKRGDRKGPFDGTICKPWAWLPSDCYTTPPHPHSRELQPKEPQQTVNVPLHPPDRRIAIVQVDDSDSTLERENWRCYAATHGYDFFLELPHGPGYEDLEIEYPTQPEQLGIVEGEWHTCTVCATRIGHVLRHLPDYDWVVQVSGDTMVVDHSYRLEQMLPDDADVVLPRRIQSHRDGSGKLVSESPRMCGCARAIEGRENLFLDYPNCIGDMLHTELIAVRNSDAGKRFVELFLRFGMPCGMIFDMGAVHSALLYWLFDPRVAAFYNRFSEAALLNKTIPMEFGGYIGKTDDHDSLWFTWDGRRCPFQCPLATAHAHWWQSSRVLRLQREWTSEIQPRGKVVLVTPQEILPTHLI
uniref:Uncharacterized protein n=1 Tax=Chromera velia CCMP2878 TaxID=1169474 RepID=A0A0G4I3H2_9ALVE|eukprot:Cvel_35482.t1-p1 / transcript=Cvel_35482.t1 / gene=Cvel_35482 / organism=Chromera_velia_CCMP2878 / gene_product=hypothetical protein / transcript_product=hypothetical protein / location=Cvel_scaffold6499:1052-2926(+) / protein_length=534 / sequence_SO=supercontig / SO=protein_coding / is_pseudo=false